MTSRADYETNLARARHHELLCPECGCSLDDHHFKADYQAYAAALRNDEPDMYLERAPNPCADCDACPRDEEGL